MKQRSQLRDLFHELPNSMNGINVVAYTFAYYLETLDFGALKSNIEVEISNKLDDIEDYYKKACDTFKAISKIVDNAGISGDCSAFMNAITRELKEIQIFLNDIKNMHQRIQNDNFKKKVLNIAKELYKFESKCCSIASIVKEFKNKLISLDKYYKV